jgi:hypothetical protein
MLLSRPTIAGTLALLGETEASSAGEQLAEGYPSRAVTDPTSGEVFGPPQPPSCGRYCPPMPQKTPARRAERKPVGPALPMWSEYPEKCGHIIRNAHDEVDGLSPGSRFA